MYCKHCGKEISETAKFCDGCGKSVSEETKPVAAPVVEEKPKKKKKRHPILGTILLVIGIFIVIGALAGGGDEPQKVDTAEPSATNAPAETTEPEVFTVGDTLEMNDVLVTLNDVYEITGSQFLKPTDGNIFVICEFTIENNSDSELAVSSMMSFEAYFDDYAANLSLGATTADQSKQQLDGTVAPGKKINGVVGYEAPADWAEIEVRFAPNAFTSDSFVFNYCK